MKIKMDQEVRIRIEEPNQGDGTPAESHLVGLSADQVVHSLPGQEQVHTQFGTQINFRWSRDRNDRTAENAFSAPWFFSEMELEPAAG